MLHVLTAIALAAPAVTAELAGSGGLGSINLLAPITDGERLPLDLRVGLSVFPIDANTGTVVIVPLAVEMHTRGTWQLVGGLGQGLSITTKGAPHVRGLVRAGGRWAPSDRLFVGATYTPLFSYLLDRQWEHWAGVELGVRIGGHR